MKTLLFITCVPIIVMALACLARFDLFFSQGTSTQDALWQFVGVAFGYAGVVFSGYAVFEVRRLTRRFIDKQILPELQKQIEDVLKEMSNLGGGKLSDLKGARVVSRISVILRQLSQSESPGVVGVVKKASAPKLSLERRIKQWDKPAALSEVTEYWTLFEVLSELADQIDADNRENGARP